MIGFLGGTGLEGRGLALRFALAGEQVVIGSRQAARAQEAARAVSERGPVEGVSGARNREAAEQADVVFITCPYQAQIGLLEPLAEALAGKLVVSTVAPLVFDEGSAGLIGVPEGSAAEQAGRLLPEFTDRGGVSERQRRRPLVAAPHAGRGRGWCVRMTSRPVCRRWSWLG